MKIPYLEECWEDWKDHPLYKSFYPRRIACPHGFVNPKYYSIVCAGLEHMDTTPLEEKAVAHDLANAGMPTYFLAPEFLEAVLSTTPASRFKVDDVKLPLQSMLLCIPASISMKYFGFLIPFVGYTLSPIKDNPGKQVFVFHGILIPSDGKPNGYYGRVPTHDEIDGLSQYDYVDHTLKCEKELEDRWLVLGKRNLDKHDKDVELPTGSEDRHMPDKIFSMLLKLFLILNTRPSFINVLPNLNNGKGSKQLTKAEVKRDFWQPNFIGLGYRAERPPTPTGTHESPRMHWRRGHLRRVRFGKGRTEVRTVWIEPVLVNAL